MLHFRWIITQKLKKKRRIFENPPLKNRSAWKAETYLEAYSSMIQVCLNYDISKYGQVTMRIEIDRKTFWKIYFSKHLAKKVETLRKASLGNVD